MAAPISEKNTRFADAALVASSLESGVIQEEFGRVPGVHSRVLLAAASSRSCPPDRRNAWRTPSRSP
jgi:hypothetical protein